MTGLRDVLTEAAESYFQALEADGYRPEGCSGEDLADAIVAALDAAPGVVVTQLPKPSHSGTISTSFRHVTAWDKTHQVCGESRLITLDDPGRCMSAAEARILAADLLAAAAVLSEGEDE